MNVQTLDVISVNLWQIIISLCNLLIMFWILKKFLFRPVQNIIAQRQKEVETIYSDAQNARDDADTMRTEYESQLADARTQADGIVREATSLAQRKSEAIVAEANYQASHMKQKAQQEIELEKRQMLREVQHEISDIAVSIASKVVEREVRAEDHEAFVEDFIAHVGDRS
ncbi:MAG: F0F1 ATP synthase subunit B [Clostridia bacterium]|nr:F0F1 ATP synthase subunit B [Clostridia bacterium]